MDKLLDSLILTSLILLIVLASSSKDYITGSATGIDCYDLEILTSDTIDYDNDLIVGVELTYCGNPVEKEKVDSVNFSLILIKENNAENILNAEMQSHNQGIWFTTIPKPASQPGNYIIKADASLNNSIRLQNSKTISIIIPKGLTIRSITPKLLPLGYPASLALEISDSGSYIEKENIKDAALVIMHKNGTGWTSNLNAAYAEKGLISSTHTFTQPGLYQLNWSFTLFNISHKITGLIFVDDISSRLDSLDLDANSIMEMLNIERSNLKKAREGIGQISETRQEAIFLMTDSLPNDIRTEERTIASFTENPAATLRHPSSENMKQTDNKLKIALFSLLIINLSLIKKRLMHK